MTIPGSVPVRFLRRLGVCMLLALFLAAAGASGQDDGRRNLQLDDYLSWETVANPRISPDGATVVYERRFVDPVADGVRGELWVVGADGSRNRFLTEGAGPRWSPDGTRIAFTRSGEPRGSQIFVRWMDAEGAESQITRLENPPSQIGGRPDSGSLAFRAVVSPAPDPAWDIDMPRAPDGADWTAPPRIVTRLGYRRDGSGYTPAGYRHIFVVDAAGGTPRQVTSGDFHHDGPRFTPDGGGIVFSGLREPDAEYAWRQSEVYRVDLETREITVLTRPRRPRRRRRPLARRPRHRLHRHGPHDGHLSRGGPLRDGRRRLGPAGRRHRDGTAPRHRGLGRRRRRRLPERAAPGNEQPPLRVGRRRGPAGDDRQPHALGVVGQRERRRGRRRVQLPRARRPRRVRRRRSGHDAHAAPHQRGAARRRPTGRRRGDLVPVAGRARHPGVDRQAARLRPGERVPAHPPHPRRPPRDVQRRVRLQEPGPRGERLRGALHEPPRQQRLRERVRQRNQERLPGRGLRRLDGGGGTRSSPAATSTNATCSCTAAAAGAS